MSQKLPNKKMWMITMPKSGSHLLMKGWWLITKEEPIWYSPESIGQPQSYFWTHFYYQPRLIDPFFKDPNYQVVINIRDLRDVCISMVYHLLDSNYSWLSPDEKMEYKQLSFDEQLKYVITTKEHKRAPCFFVEQVINKVHEPNALILRYEDLVGAQGGGCKNKQLEQIKRLTQAFNLSFSMNQLGEIADQMYGRIKTSYLSDTFREGKIGGWKKHFQESNKKLFKKNFGHFLVSMGYENDESW